MSTDTVERTTVDVDLEAVPVCEHPDCPALPEHPPAVARLVSHHERCGYRKVSLVCGLCVDGVLALIRLGVMGIICPSCGHHHVCRPHRPARPLIGCMTFLPKPATVIHEPSRTVLTPGGPHESSQNPMNWLVELAKVDPQLAQGAMVMLGVIALFVACGIGAGLSGLGRIGQTVHEHVCEHDDADPQAPVSSGMSTEESRA